MAGPRAGSTWGEAQINGPQEALVSYVVAGVALAAFALMAYWAGVAVARGLGRKAGFSLAPLGFSRPRGGLLSGLGLGFAVGAAAIFVGMFVNLATVSVFGRLGLPTESTVQAPYMQGLSEWVRESPGVAIPAIVFVVVIFGPAFEEFIFRGVVFNVMYRLGNLASANLGGGDPGGAARKTSFVLAALVSSALFALLHLEPVLLPALLLVAVALCALFARTGSLLPPFVAHATFNSFAVTFVILSGLGVFELPA